MFIENLGDRFIAAVLNTVGLNAGDESSFSAQNVKGVEILRHSNGILL